MIQLICLLIGMIFFVHKSDEKEKSQGFNFKYDFRLSNFISGNLKIGNKYRTKKEPIIVIMNMAELECLEL